MKEYKQQIKNLNYEIEQYKKDKNSNNEESQGFKKLISIINIGTKEEKDDNLRSKNSDLKEKRFSKSSYDFFDKKQLTGKFGEEEGNIKNSNNENNNRNELEYEKKIEEEETQKLNENILKEENSRKDKKEENNNSISIKSDKIEKNIDKNNNQNEEENDKISN